MSLKTGKNSKIVITGAGVISAIGIGKAQTLHSLQTSQTGIAQMRYLQSSHRELPVGEVKLSNEELMEHLGIEDEPRLTRTALLGQIALREALDEAHLLEADLSDVPFISATTVGGMDRRELHHEEEPWCEYDGAVIATHNCATSTEMTALHYGPFAMMSTVSTACSSATNAIISGANMLRCGMAEKVVCGGAECLSLFHLNGFNTLMILDHELCKPFDADRHGLNLGEGAAYVVLETEASAQQRHVQPLAMLSGYGNACDAFHQTASSPDGEGAYRSMCQALRMASLQPSDIHYINAHGTGTQNNDASESVAIKRVFGNDVPPFSSTKGFTGHTTSASGSIEAVICLLALNHQFLPMNINWQKPMDNGLVPVHNSQHPSRRIIHILSNAFGFGGNDSSLILSAYND